MSRCWCVAVTVAVSCCCVCFVTAATAAAAAATTAAITADVCAPAQNAQGCAFIRHRLMPRALLYGIHRLLVEGRASLTLASSATGRFSLHATSRCLSYDHAANPTTTLVGRGRCRSTAGSCRASGKLVVWRESGIESRGHHAAETCLGSGPLRMPMRPSRAPGVLSRRRRYSPSGKFKTNIYYVDSPHTSYFP